MKLRLDKNSIRLRVKKSDLEKLREENFAEEKINFPNEEFGYRLSVSDHAKEISVKATPSFVEVIVPSSNAHAWLNNDAVGIYHTIHFSNRTLDIIIEKDFPCTADKTEDKSDAFTELAELNDAKRC
ncbi:MAG: DUF7009 family protein [Chitinophagales bacterium]